MMIAENADEIDRLHNSGQNKYQYKANVNTVISVLAEKVVQLFIVSNRERKKILKFIYSEITINNLRNYPKIYRYALWLYICIFQYWYMFFKRLSCGQ